MFMQKTGLTYASVVLVAIILQINSMELRLSGDYRCSIVPQDSGG